MSSAKRSSSVKVLPTVLGVIIVVALIAIAGEIGVRMFVSKEISDGYRTSAEERGATVTEDPKVSFGTRPMLLALATKSVPSMDLSTPNTLEVKNPEALGGAPEINGDPAAEVHLENVDLSNRADPTAESLRVDVTIPPQLLQALINRESDVRASTITPLPDEGLFNIEFASGFATSKFRPIANGGHIEINLEGGSILGLNLDGLAGWLGEASGTLLSYDIGHGMQVEEAHVTGKGLALTLTGANLPLSTVSELTFS